jgi:hypothetical protein
MTERDPAMTDPPAMTTQIESAAGAGAIDTGAFVALERAFRGELVRPGKTPGET